MTTSVRKGWAPRKLNELGFVGRGRSRHRPRNAPELYGGPYPFVQTADIMASEFLITSYSKTYSEAGLAQSKMWQPNTLCMTIAGENTAETAILSFPACFPDSVVGFIADPAMADVRFVKYYLDHIKRQIRQITRGATQDNLSLDKLLSFDIVSPPIEQQAKIAAVASSYDELILNNARRIAILEEMAQALYQEWFVHFRFPGNDKARLIESSLGKIPDGWKVFRLDDVCEKITSGGTPRTDTDEYWGGGIPWLSSGETGNRFIIGTDKTITKEGITNSSTKFARSGCTVIASAGQGKTRGQTSLLLLGCYINQSTIALISNRKHANDYFLFFDVLRRYKQFRQISDGSSRGSLTTKLLADLEIVIPPSELVNEFESLVGPVVRKIECNLKRNVKLRQLRDLLLPKLISGQLDVGELDIEMGGSVTA